MVVRNAPVISQQVHDDVEPVRVEVVEHLDVTPRMRRVRFAGDVAALPADGPTDHAKIFFPTMPGVEPERPEIGPRGLLAPLPGRSRPYREYTLRSVADGVVEVDFVRHGSGLAGSWVEDPAGALWLYGPRSSLVADPRDWYLLGGDETALPALTRWLARLPATASATVFVEVADAAEEQELPSSAAVDVHWLHRDGAEPGTTTPPRRRRRRLVPTRGGGARLDGRRGVGPAPRPSPAARPAAHRVDRPRRLLAPRRGGHRSRLIPGCAIRRAGAADRTVDARGGGCDRAALRDAHSHALSRCSRGALRRATRCAHR